MLYDPTPDLLRIVSNLPKSPYSVAITTRVGKSDQVAGLISVATAADGTVQIRIRRDSVGGRDRIDQIYQFQRGVLTATDQLSHEYLRRRYSPKSTWDQRLTDPLGTARDAVRFLLDRKDAVAQMKALARFGTWTKGTAGDYLTYQSTRGRVFSTDKSGRLVGISAGSGEGMVRFSYKWSRQSLIARPLLFADSVLVDSFTEKRALPRSDAGTQDLARRMLRAHQRFVRGTVTVSGTSILLNGRAIGEKRRNSAWSFDGRILAVKDAKGKFSYRQARRRDEVLPTLAKRGVTVDPYTRNLLNRNIPFRDLLFACERMRTVGTMGSGSQAMAILEATGTGRRLVLTVGPNGLVRESDSTVQAGSQKLISTRKYSYDPRVPVIKN